jgi:hypothetical protein
MRERIGGFLEIEEVGRVVGLEIVRKGGNAFVMLCADEDNSAEGVQAEGLGENVVGVGGGRWFGEDVVDEDHAHEALYSGCGGC